MAKPTVWAGFDRAVQTRQLRTIAMISGEVGVGKTRFALTGAGPVFVQSLDRGLEGTVNSVLDNDPDKEIYVREYEWDASDDDAHSKAIELRDQILSDFNHGLKNARTVVWDRETDIREVFQYAEFGDPVGGNVKDYAKLNQKYFNLINKVKSVPGINFFLIQSMKDEWMVTEAGINQQTGKPKKSFSKTGRRLKAGFERLDELVMTELHFRREGGDFFIDIGKCRQAANLQDTSIPGMTFPEFGTLLIEGSEVEEWS